MKLYESRIQGYVESLGVNVDEFYKQLAAIRNDTEIKDKKLLHFVTYLIASTDYENFYKVMVRAAKREKAKAAESKSEAKFSSPSRDAKGYTSDRKDYK